MRVIAGRVKSTPLVAPKGRGTRPTQDRIKEALFSSIQGRLAGAVVLDLFAGSGALGIEALSRGASSAVFVESGRPALVALRENLRRTGLEEHSRVLPLPVETALGRLAAEGGRFDLVFADPPYRRGWGERLLGLVARHATLRPGGILVLEHEAGWRPAVARAVRCRRYGDTELSYFVEGEGDDRAGPLPGDL